MKKQMLNKSNTDVVGATRKGTDPVTLHPGGITVVPESGAV